MAERYGDYELFQQIATGGMAEIHLARQTGFGGVNRLVIIKRMLPQLAVRPDFVTMFLDEARLTAALQHPNIVRVHDLGSVKGSYFIAMELVDGPHLGSMFAHSLRSRRPLPVDLCAWIAARSADGLHYAHEMDDPATGVALDLVHRDISPQNILVGKSGDVKVTDFGVAKASNQQTKTRTGIIKGKVAYMSPEQCLGDQLDRRTDVFALGIVLYELVTRRRLFRDKSDLLIMQKITGEDVAAASSVNPQVDAGLDLILKKCLSRDLGGRYQTALELAEALDIWLAGRVDDRALAGWFEENCAELAPSATISEDALQAPPAPDAANEPTSATPSLSSQETMRNLPAPGSAGHPHPGAMPISGRDEPTALAPFDITMLGGGNPAAPGGPPLDTLDRLDVASFEGGEDAVRSRAIPRAALAGTLAAVVVLIVAILLAKFGDAEPVEGPKVVPVVPAMGRVRVVTVPSGIPIIVGDRIVGSSPVETSLPPGKARVQAQFPDQPARSIDVDVGAGGVTEVRLQAWVPLIVRSTPSRARLMVDGTPRGETPFEQGFLVEPGVAIALRLEAPGMQMYEEDVVATPGERLVHEVKMVPLELGGAASARKPREKEEVGFGTLSVRTEPWTLASWGGEKLGETPFKDRRVKAGRQNLVVTNPQFGINDSIPVAVGKDKAVVVILRFEKQGAVYKRIQTTIK
ncbi:MAG: serine/threonine-protein kinase [Deltaproteobacteria bacterium]|nr:serine/threonine-protein kinase [Deltaproteobacteria bacterium]